MTEQEIQYAKDNYPIGTSYKCANSGKTVFTIVGDKTTYKDTGKAIYADNCKGCLYYNGKWAEIVFYPEGFVKDKIINEYQIY